MEKRIIIILITIAFMVAPPWIFMIAWFKIGSLYGKFDEKRYQPSDSFKIKEWKAPDLKYRYSVLNYVINSIVTVGMTKKEVEEKLGVPNSINQKGEWQYDVQRPGWRYVDFSGGGVLVQFDSAGKVSQVSDNTWID